MKSSNNIFSDFKGLMDWEIGVPNPDWTCFYDSEGTRYTYFNNGLGKFFIERMKKHKEKLLSDR